MRWGFLRRPLTCGRLDLRETESGYWSRSRGGLCQAHRRRRPAHVQLVQCACSRTRSAAAPLSLPVRVQVTAGRASQASASGGQGTLGLRGCTPSVRAGTQRAQSCAGRAESRAETPKREPRSPRAGPEWPGGRRRRALGSGPARLHPRRPGRGSRYGEAPGGRFGPREGLRPEVNLSRRPRSGSSGTAAPGGAAPAPEPSGASGQLGRSRRGRSWAFGSPGGCASCAPRRKRGRERRPGRDGLSPGLVGPMFPGSAGGPRVGCGRSVSAPFSSPDTPCSPFRPLRLPSGSLSVPEHLCCVL